MDDQEAEMGYLDCAGVPNGNWQIWSRLPFCQSMCQEISAAGGSAATRSSDEICADVLDTDGCVAPSDHRRLSDHVLLPALVLNVEHQAGAGVAHTAIYTAAA